VNAPRFHHQWLPDMVYAEPFTFSADTAAKLEAMGYKFKEQAPWGAAEAILVAPPAAAASAAGGIDDSTHRSPLVPGHLYGANDARRPGGAAMGY